MIVLNRRCARSLELAVQEARSLGHHYLGTEHLLLGVLREEGGLASQVLLRAGVTLEKAREVVKEVLASEQKTGAQEPGQQGSQPPHREGGWGGGGELRRGTVGEVTEISGSTVKIKLPNGSIGTVNTTANTRFRKDEQEALAK